MDVLLYFADSRIRYTSKFSLLFTLIWLKLGNLLEIETGMAAGGFGVQRRQKTRAAVTLPFFCVRGGARPLIFWSC